MVCPLSLPSFFAGVGNGELLAPQQRAAYGLKVIGVYGPARQADDVDAFAHLLRVVAGTAQQVVQPGHQWLNMRGQHAACVQAAEQVLHGEQGVDLAG